MWPTVIFLTIGAACLAGVAVIVIRKFPQLSVLDVDALPEVQSARRKDEILRGRVTRRATEIGRRMSGTVTAQADRAGQWMSGLQDRLAKIEKEYEASLKATKPMAPQEKVEALINEAERMVRLGDSSRAEERYIEAISWNAKEERAYRGLAQLYHENKRYSQALETLDFLAKSIRRDNTCQHGQDDTATCLASAAAHADLGEILFQMGEILLEMGKPDLARDYLTETVAVVPMNPKYLDLLIEASLQAADHLTAEGVLVKLKSVNPENMKISSFEERLQVLREKV